MYVDVHIKGPHWSQKAHQRCDSRGQLWRVEEGHLDQRTGPTLVSWLSLKYLSALYQRVSALAMLSQSHVAFVPPRK